MRWTRTIQLLITALELQTIESMTLLLHSQRRTRAPKHLPGDFSLGRLVAAVRTWDSNMQIRAKHRRAPLALLRPRSPQGTTTAAAVVTVTLCPEEFLRNLIFLCLLHPHFPLPLWRKSMQDQECHMAVRVHPGQGRCHLPAATSLALCILLQG